MNLELDSVREQLNSVDTQTQREAWEAFAHTRYRYLRWGEAHGYTKQQRKERFGERRYWLAYAEQVSSPPSEIKLAEEVLAAVGDGGVGRQAYRFMSAFVHAQPHAFTTFLPAPLQTDPQVPGVVPLGVNIDDLTTWLMIVTLGVHTSAVRCGHYFGWNLKRWAATVHSILASWADDLGP